MSEINFNVGSHRPVYFWAGPGTIRMNQLKFMGALNDIEVHTEAHTEIGAIRITQEAGFNWVYLMYDWGFPPEIAQKDWEDFLNAVSIYKEHSVRIFGYVQTSNCVFQGSYKTKDWYVKDLKGRKSHYYTGRYLTCWHNQEWQERLRRMIKGIIEAGADGVFFDNTWFGIMPINIAGSWAGPAGCYCARCRKAFHDFSGLEIPTNIHPEGNETHRTYLDWRAESVVEILSSLIEYARSLNPEIIISMNNYDPIMHPTFIMFGIDLRKLAMVQDVIMIEDFCLPRWGKGMLVNNAITIRSAYALAGDTPITTDPYDRGIGFDKVYDSFRFQQAIAEAAACGTAMVVKGTEFVDNEGVFTLLSAEKYHPQRNAIKLINTWLFDHADLFTNRTNAARVGLLYPEDLFKTVWYQTAEHYFKICQTLTFAGTPWKVVNLEDDLSGLEILFTFQDIDLSEFGLRVICVPELDSWVTQTPSLFSRHSSLRNVAGRIMGWGYQAYFKYRWMRIVSDGLKIPQLFLQSPHFQIPDIEIRDVILDHLGELETPVVEWEKAPVLIDMWHKGGKTQLHLVNYGRETQSITVKLTKEESGKIISLNQEDIAFEGSEIQFDLDVYSILIF